LPDLEISNLPALTAASLQGTDPVAVADLSAAETKKITIKDLLEGGFDLVDDATIPAAKISGSTIGAGAVDTAQLADLAVTTAKIDTGATPMFCWDDPQRGQATLRRLLAHQPVERC
jgi:hypothetical protein